MSVVPRPKYFWSKFIAEGGMDVGSVLPLLTRELTEQAARRRTFILRTVYAAILYFCAVWLMLQKLGGWSTDAFKFLGQGEGIFREVAILQFVGIYLFLPAMTCGVLTAEKERDTLSTLLLTRLGPWSILLGKLFSRLVAMGSFFCLSMPLVAVAYSFGGVEASQIVALAWTLAVTSLLVGSLALACSAWCRTTGAAFMATYVLGTIMIMLPLAVLAALREMGHDVTDLVGAMFEYKGFAVDLNGMAHSDPPEFMLIGLAACLGDGSAARPFPATVLRTVPMLLSAGACLVFARMVLWRRAFVPPSNLLLKIFRSLDSLFHQMNQNKFTRGIVLTRSDDALPLTEPIRWREITKRSLGTTRYLVRLLLVLETLVIFGMLLSADGNSMSRFAPAYVIAWIVWIVAALVIAIHSTGLIGLEKSRQTIDVLLTTPLTSETIIREKFAGVLRMIRVLRIPLATAYLLQILWVGNPVVSDVLFAVIRDLLAMALYPQLIAWLGFHMGMRCRSQSQATLATLGILMGVCFIPLLISAGFESTDLELVIGLRWFSPIFVLVESTHYGPYGSADFQWWLCMLFHYSIAFSALTIMSRRGIKTFASYVSRNEGQIMDDDDIERLTELRRHVVGTGIFQKNHEGE